MRKLGVYYFVSQFRMLRYYYLFFLLNTAASIAICQDNSLIQVSGIIYSIEADKIRPLPYGEVSIKNTFRVMYGNETAFYSIAAQRGDTLTFNYLSYEEEFFIVPQNYKGDLITLNVKLKQDTIYLPKAIIQAWPSKEHFRPEFLAMEVEESMYQIAMANLAKDRIQELMLLTSKDGTENASLYLSQQAQKYYYAGQIKPMNIMSPLAWMEFFNAWKRGDFKKKRKK
ncbi:MAG: carboxypeptidase-like regulatory domain-containing protein [Saprospiraceae bacterium]|nr:carboxypeptidase-like regulatory domain-containing protein [Saprospiraceae bacterium]